MVPFNTFDKPLLDHIENMAMDKAHKIISTHDLYRQNYKTVSTYYAIMQCINRGDNAVVICDYPFQYKERFKTVKNNKLFTVVDIALIRDNIFNCAWFQRKLAAQFISLNQNRFIGIDFRVMNRQYFDIVNNLPDDEFNDILYSPIPFDDNLIRCNYTRGRRFSTNAKIFFDIDWRFHG